MAIDPTDQTTHTHDLVRVLADDRRRLAQRFRAATPLASAAQAVAFGALIAVPAVGDGIAMVFGFVAVSFAFLGIEALFRRRLGFSIDLPAGVRGWAAVIGLGVGGVALTLTSLVLVLTGNTPWVAAAAGLGVVASWVLIAAYDRSYVTDLVRPFADPATAGGPRGDMETAHSLAGTDATDLRIAATLRPVTSARLDALLAVLDTASLDARLPALQQRGLIAVMGAGPHSSISLSRDGRRAFDEWAHHVRP